MKIIGIGEVAALCGLSRRTIYAEVSAGRFPRPIQLTARRVGWIETEVLAWLERRIAERDGVAA